jgi:thiazole/oxazole-forming peptide maturase SagD family component
MPALRQPTVEQRPRFLEDPGPKAFREGTHRLIAPETTLSRIGPLMPEMGITRVANVTGLDAIGIPVALAVRPNSRGLAVSQGKGLNLAAAKASAVEVDHLPRVSDRAFHPHLELLWIEGYDLLQAETVWLPYELVHVNSTLPLPTGSGCFPITSNGLASGNHPLEAISHALCEVIERDAMAVWLQTDREAIHAARVDISHVDDPACQSVLEKYDRAGVSVSVWEITSDVGISAFFCGITDRETDSLRQLHAAAGQGCHPSRPIALLRALTEAAQSRLTIIAGSRDDFYRDDFKHARSVDTTQRTRALATDIQGPMRSFAEGPHWDGETFEDDCAWVLDRLQSVGITRAIVVDLTMPEFQVPVMRTVVPGLEGATDLTTYVPGARALAARRGRA